MPSAPNNGQLIALLKKTFSDLTLPLDLSIRAVWRGQSAPPEAKMVLENQLLATAKRFINVRSCSEEEKQRYLEQVASWFDISAEKNVFPLPRTRAIGHGLDERVESSPVSISYLEEYDRRFGLNYADRARHALFQFANFVIKSDGTVTENEAAELLEFKLELYPRGDEPPEIKAAASTETKPDQVVVVEDENPRPIEELLGELDGLVGLERVKSDVRQLINFLKVQKMREKEGMEPLPISRHLVFYGNPGTGKTTIARLLAQIYRTLKILERGHLVETDRSGLVAGYVGQTALKVKGVVNDALGGLLFVDEAYSLNPEGRGNDFGQEAVETLLKLMEDHRKELIVIVAGYTGKMEEFIASNPGLRSRFNRFFHFEDYTPKELVEIFKGFCAKADFKLTPDAETKLMSLFEVLSLKRDESFGNARTARNLFELTISKQANRIVTLPKIDHDVLATIEAEDVPEEDEGSKDRV